MKWLKIIGGIAYALSFIVASILFFGYEIGLDPKKSINLFLGLGATGFILNLISYSKDKLGNPKANLIYWTGSLLIFIGLAAFIMQYNYSMELIILGGVIIIISLFRYKKSNALDKKIRIF